jgi:uroporphyrinogen decarboxylase
MLPEKMKVIALSGKIFTLTWMLMGFNNFAAKLIMEEDLVADVFRKVAEIQFKCLEEIFKMPHVGAVWLVDDLAFGTGPMISPEAFRKHVFPWYKEIARRCHENDRLVLLHTDGDLTLLMDDIIALGIDVLHPIDPTCMDIETVKKTYGDRLAIAAMWPMSCCEAPVRLKSKTGSVLIRRLAPGGGYLLCPAIRWRMVPV